MSSREKKMTPFLSKIKNLIGTFMLAFVGTFGLVGVSMAGGIVRPPEKPAISAMVEYEKPAFTGAYVGAELGYGRGSVKVEDFVDMSLNGASLGVHGGYWHAVSPNWRIGAELAYKRHNADGSENLFSGSDFDYNITSEKSSSLSARVQAGYVVNQATMVYGFAGYERAKGKIGENLTYSGETLFEDSVGGTVKGSFVGLGAERMLTNNLSLAGEISRHRLSGEVGNIAIKARDTQVGLRLNYRF